MCKTCLVVPHYILMNVHSALSHEGSTNWMTTWLHEVVEAFPLTKPANDEPNTLPGITWNTYIRVFFSWRDHSYIRTYIRIPKPAEQNAWGTKNSETLIRLDGHFATDATAIVMRQACRSLCNGQSLWVPCAPWTWWCVGHKFQSVWEQAPIRSIPCVKEFLTRFVTLNHKMPLETNFDSP